MNTKKIIIIVLPLVLLLVVLFVFKTLYQSGAFKSINDRDCCTCVSVSGVPGTEDIVLDRRSGTAFLSSHDRRSYMKGDDSSGGIYRYTLAGYPDTPELLTGYIDFPFHPHGISLIRTEKGGLHLFVINHRTQELTTVEIFQYRDRRLEHDRTIKNKLMISPNDILAVGEWRFYFTNDHGAESSFARTLEDYLQLPLGSVVFCSGSDCKKVAGGFTYANGINMSSDGVKVYVAATTGRFLRIFDRNPADNSLEKQRDLKLKTGLDNIDIDEQGTLWVTGHPKLLTFIKHSSDPSVNSPSQIIRIDPQKDYEHEFVYENSGEEVSGASVAVRYRDRLLIGNVFEPFILDCRINSSE